MDDVLEAGDGAGGVVVGGAGAGVVDEDAGASFVGPGTGAVPEAGAVAATFSKNHAAAKPSLPPGSRTRTHWLLCPIFAAPSESRSSSCVPAGTVITKFAMLDVSVLERIFNPHVTESITRAWTPPVEAGTVVGWG